jgi:hypothetical protein
MNEFVAQKLALILAFAEVGSEIYLKAKPAMEGAFGVERVAQIIKSNTTQIETINKIGRECEITEILEREKEKNKNKIKLIENLCMSDNWSSTEETLEWLGLFEGAIMVYWSFVLGASEAFIEEQKTLTHNDLNLVASLGYNLHSEILRESNEQLRKIGYKKSNPSIIKESML